MVGMMGSLRMRNLVAGRSLAPARLLTEEPRG